VIAHVLEEEITSLGSLRHLRDHCDTDADIVLPAIQGQLQNISEHESLRRKHDLFDILQAGTKTDPVLAQFWSDVNSVPDWVHWPQLERGQRVFHRYILASITGFVLQGFVGENSAASGVVEVLTRTGGFEPKNLARRLKETFRWLIEVTSDLQSIQPGGNGHADTIRVRLLHAQVRRRVLTLAERKPGYYNSAKYGLPINTLDSVHSISTFCCSPMWSQLPKIGIQPTEDEIEDYVALFRYLGHLLGVPQRLFDTTSRAKTIMHLMMEHESQPSATSQTVAHNFIRTITSTKPYKLSDGFVAAGSRSMNGDELCDKLNIHRPTLLHYATFRGCCWLAITLCHLQRWCTALDEYVINVRRAHGSTKYTLTSAHRLLAERSIGSSSILKSQTVRNSHSSSDTSQRCRLLPLIRPHRSSQCRYVSQWTSKACFEAFSCFMLACSVR
jgi:hypothetical protein